MRQWPVYLKEMKYSKSLKSGNTVKRDQTTGLTVVDQAPAVVVEEVVDGRGDDPGLKSQEASNEDQ